MRETIGLNKGWKFTTDVVSDQRCDAYLLTKTGAQCTAAAMSYDDSGWKQADLPHDYTVSGKLDPLYNDYNGYLLRPNAWYRRYFYLDQKDIDKRLILRFEGVSGESRVWVNGCLMKVSYSSYCGFDVDITDVARFGQEVNLITVYLDNHRVEGWWYQAGGIYRRVILIKTAEEYLKEDSSFVFCRRVKENLWKITAEIEINKRVKNNKELNLSIDIRDPQKNTIFYKEARTVFPERSKKITFEYSIQSPILWDIGAGNLYQCKWTLREQNTILDETEENFGIREFEFTADQGFYLNGRRHEIRGLCYHEDEGNLGWTMDQESYEKRVKNLIAMGGNAYRCSHNPPAKELLDICDKYGVLVMDEVRKFETSEIGLDELRYMIRRDRNHPSIILWSMGNEETWQGEDRGARIMCGMREAVRELDSTRPVTMAMHDGFFNSGAALYSDVIGVNYNHDLFDKIHAAYPDKPMIGAENMNLADHFQDRTREDTGSDQAYQTLENIQKSPFVAGTFGWAGQDYRGEHRNLAFFTDCCPTDCIGGRKDGFYQYASYWRQDPVLHICGHWNDTGELTRIVTIYSNMEKVLLFLNGDHIGEKKPDLRKKIVFEVEYQEGILEAVGLQNGSEVIRTQLVSTKEPCRFQVVPEKKTIHADGQERVFLYVTAVDENGRRHPTASEDFHVRISGPGRVLCTDNPDAYSTWRDTPYDMNVYKGMARVVLEAGEYAGTLNVQIESKLLEGCSCSIQALPAQVNEMPVAGNPYINEWFVSYVFEKKPDVFAWPTDDYYVTWRKYWEPATLEARLLPFFRRKGFVIFCQEQNLPKVSEGHVPALVFEKVSGKAEFLISARDYNNKIIKQVHIKKETELPEKVRITLPDFVTGDRMIMKAVIQGEKTEDGIAGNVRFEL